MNLMLSSVVVRMEKDEELYSRFLRRQKETFELNVGETKKEGKINEEDGE